ncbi:hypothetical protein Pcinc_036785 [Petrolisthes cinctipes]|uniref:Uncharacterized protein n=1 Tax=Petrolisthes cinctipes TaxID=88211 RepID=A0AAE1ELM8_PETCI|nr:hypothetical protein Pcinc_036785 [Petrolisthes cinctipes]
MRHSQSKASISKEEFRFQFSPPASLWSFTLMRFNGKTTPEADCKKVSKTVRQEKQLLVIIPRMSKSSAAKDTTKEDNRKDACLHCGRR